MGALLVAVTAAGCLNVGPAVYPIGMCGTGGTNNLGVLRDAGFNLVLQGTARHELDTAWLYGLRVAGPAGLETGKPGNKEQVRQRIRESDGHPGLWAWFLADEPEMRGVSPAEVARANRLMKSLGARKPTLLVLFQGYAAQDYANLADVIGCDRYPIPWLPLANFSQHLKLARLALGRDKPLIAIIQAFDWKYYPEQLPEPPERLRPPTGAEIRCMTYCALAEGATGLMYYSYDDGPGRWRMVEHPETWRAVCDTVAEVRRRLPLFEGKHVWWNKNHRYADRERRFNAALLSSVSAVLVEVRPGNAVVPPGQYIVAVNTTDQEQGYSFTPPPGCGSGLPVFEEGRALVVDGGWVTDRFEPYGVHVYGPFRGL
jgi:hypothetical protein